jgi:pimeloyl-ACP methyl ester carboxylesterase
MSESDFKEGHVEADGFRVRYLEAGQGDSVVVLDSTAWGWSPLNDALAKTYRVVVFEVPGMGSSSPNTTSGSVNDLANTMAQAAASVVPGKFTLIGTSFAANVALRQALLSPDSVEALVLISPTAIRPAASVPTPTLDEMKARMSAHPENIPSLPFGSIDYLAQEQSLAMRLGGAASDSDVEGRLGDIQCATLAVFGLADKTVAPEAAAIYREKIPNSNVSIVYDAGHLIALDRPEALIDAVTDYVERRETFIVGRQRQIINP